MDSYDYIHGLRDINVVNPLVSGRLIPMTEYECFSRIHISKYLEIRRNKLINRFYSRRIFRNKCIKTIGTIIPCLILFGIELYGIHLLSQSVNLSGSNGSWIGINIAMSLIALGLWVNGVLDDNFPTESWQIDINKRKIK